MSTVTDVVSDQDAKAFTDDEIATIVRRLRCGEGWTQETLAELSGLSARTIQRVEDGKGSSLDTRRALASAFELPDLDYFNQPGRIPDEVEVARLMNQCEQLRGERKKAEDQITNLDRQMKAAQTVLNLAAARDARWLHMVRTTMMPKQPQRVPFHNALEVALRGYHCCMRTTPKLQSVTWSALPYNEGGLHRGFNAGIIFRGADFAPGVTLSMRWPKGPDGLTDGTPFRQPSIYFGDYLELSTTNDPDETPLSYRHFEFAVRNPDGETSEWVRFSYPYDFGKLRGICEADRQKGIALLADGNAGEAVEPLRRSMVMQRGLFGHGSSEHQEAEIVWNSALDQAALQKLRFREGQRLRIIDGPHAGAVGRIERLLLRHFHAYYIKLDETGEMIQAADAQVELVA